MLTRGNINRPNRLIKPNNTYGGDLIYRICTTQLGRSFGACMLNLAVGFNLILLSWGYQSQKNMSSKSNIAYIFAKPSIANLSTSFPAAPASHLWPRNFSAFSVHSEGHFAAPGHMMVSNLPKGLEPKKTSSGKYGSHWLVLAGSWQKKPTSQRFRGDLRGFRSGLPMGNLHPSFPWKHVP